MSNKSKRIKLMIKLLALSALLLESKRIKDDKVDYEAVNYYVYSEDSTDGLSSDFSSIKRIGRYRRGSIYIGNNLNDLNKFNYIKAENDILVYDERNKKEDPNLRVLDSYKITDKEEQKQIIDNLIIYNQRFPENYEWRRTRSSLLREWELHNLSYNLNYDERNHTADCDFNNNDENLFQFVKNHYK